MPVMWLKLSLVVPDCGDADNGLVHDLDDGNTLGHVEHEDARGLALGDDLDREGLRAEHDGRVDLGLAFGLEASVLLQPARKTLPQPVSSSSFEKEEEQEADGSGFAGHVRVVLSQLAQHTAQRQSERPLALAQRVAAAVLGPAPCSSPGCPAAAPRANRSTSAATKKMKKKKDRRTSSGRPVLAAITRLAKKRNMASGPAGHRKSDGNRGLVCDRFPGALAATR